MLLGKQISCSPLSQNAYLPIFLMFEKSKLVKFEHSEKQSAGITSHVQFHVTERSSLHPPNVHSDMHSIFWGKQATCSPLLLNAWFSIFFTPEKSKLVKFEQKTKQSAGITSHVQFHVTECSSLHPLKAPSEMHSMFFGKQTSCSPLSLKAYCPIFFMPEKSNCVKFEHSKKQKSGITSHLWFHVTELSFSQL